MGLEPNFEAALSKADMENGELKHAETERLRKISMSAGLTHSSAELSSLFEDNPSAFHDALEFGLKSLEQYQLVTHLMENAILRIYSVAKTKPAWDSTEESQILEEKMANFISLSSREDQH
ncbi:MAG: hypothetical protein DHS20C12_07740 [Pseudohongiella sp.]|nr:MAG: hypothetical protein DHS20C12_07740 [Pseudohongiella sp.]